MPVEALDDHPVSLFDDLLDDALLAFVLTDEYFDTVALEERPVFYELRRILNYLKYVYKKLILSAINIDHSTFEKFFISKFKKVLHYFVIRKIRYTMLFIYQGISHWELQQNKKNPVLVQYQLHLRTAKIYFENRKRFNLKILTLSTYF